MAMTDLRIVTINTAKCDGPYAERLRALASQLRELRPDVLLLQESFATCDGSADTAMTLATELEMQITFAPARRKARRCEGRDVLSDSGLAILSRCRSLDVLTIELPSDLLDGQRIAQLGLLKHNGIPVFIANVHLTHLRHAVQLRAAQLMTVLHHSWTRAPVAARLICGDFNARLAELAPAFDEHWNVRDSFELGNGQGPRWTVPARQLEPGSEAAGRCIDYILSVAETSQAHPQFDNSAIVLNRPDPDSGIFPSDHFGVATVLSLSREQAIAHREGA